MKEKKETKKIKELEDSRRRIAADFENYRKRVENERMAWAAAAKADLILKLTPVLDDFRRASAQADPENQWAQGILAIEKQLEKIFEEEGVTKIAPAENTLFDPNLHEAISHEANQRIPADHIIAVTEGGWQWGGKILKPAKVRVSRGLR